MVNVLCALLLLCLAQIFPLPLRAEPAAPTVVREPRSAEARFQEHQLRGDGLPQTAPVFPAIRNTNLGISLTSVHDWSVEQPFLDLMKTARPWIGHLPGQWGGWTEADLRAGDALDAEGWPRFVPAALEGISTVLLTDLPEDAGGLAGRYFLRYEGQGRLELGGRAQGVQSRPGEMRFDFTPGEGAVVVTLRGSDPLDPLRQIRVVREDRAALLEAGELFNPDFLARLRGVRLLRFMDWLAINNATFADVAERPRPRDYSWARQGVPLEIALALANQLGADAWVNVPHLADDALAREMAEIVKRDLSPALKSWVEYSNEVWNWQFQQAAWAEAQAKKLWGIDSGWVSFYGKRAAEVMGIWAEVLRKDRLVRVVAVQTGWKGLEPQILTPEPMRQRGEDMPVNAFDAYAVTGYFSARLGYEDKQALLHGWLQASRANAEAEAAAQGLTADAAAAFTHAHRFDLALDLAARELRDGGVTGNANDSLQALATDIFPYHAAVARAHGLDLVMYEGGSHVVGIGPVVEDAAPTDFFIALNASPQMGLLYRELMAIWAQQSPAPFMSFGSIYPPSKWGAWGGLRHLWDDTPRWEALRLGCDAC